MLDNMGYKDSLLLVKGGKKIFKTGCSKLFKIIFPINQNLKWIYESEHS